METKLEDEPQRRPALVTIARYFLVLNPLPPVILVLVLFLGNLSYILHDYLYVPIFVALALVGAWGFYFWGHRSWKVYRDQPIGRDDYRI